MFYILKAIQFTLEELCKVFLYICPYWCSEEFEQQHPGFFNTLLLCKFRDIAYNLPILWIPLLLLAGIPYYLQFSLLVWLTDCSCQPRKVPYLYWWQIWSQLTLQYTWGSSKHNRLDPGTRWKTFYLEKYRRIYTPRHSLFLSSLHFC